MGNNSSYLYSNLNKKYNTLQMNSDSPYNDIKSYQVSSLDQCASDCYDNTSCAGFVTNKAENYCWLKNVMGNTNYNSDRNSYVINRTNPSASYIQYDNLLLNDGTNNKQLTNVPSECVTACVNDPNCRGLNLILNTGQNQVATDGYNYQDVPKVTCEFVSNISYSNSKTSNPNSKFFAKNNNLNFENNVPYLLKNSRNCLSVQQDSGGNNKLIGSDCNDSSKVTPVLFNTQQDMIKVGTEGDSCLIYTNDGLDLLKCNNWDQNQKFIYDHVYNTLRPASDTTQCITTTKTTQPDGSPLYTYGMGACGNPSDSNNIIFENYYKPNQKDDYIEYFEKDYSVDMTYYIIYMVLLCMIAYLVIMSSVSNKNIN